MSTCMYAWAESALGMSLQNDSQYVNYESSSSSDDDDLYMGAVGNQGWQHVYVFVYVYVYGVVREKTHW